MFPNRPYDPRWTAHLISRDVKDIKNRLVSRIKEKCSRRQGAKNPAASLVANTGDSMALYPDIITSKAEPKTMYEILQTMHKETYCPRDPERSKVDHHKYRGSWLLLQMAIQNSPSNPIFDIFRPDCRLPDDSTLLVEVIRQNILQRPSLSSPAETSRMPGELDHKRNSIHVRIDSALSNISPTTPRLCGNPLAPQLWYGVLEGVTDKSRTIQAAETLLGYVWPDQIATDVLEKIGTPDKCLSAAEDEDLREQLRLLLLPESKAFGSARPITS
ncbi:hypothetical protein ACN47E_002283 [Coniothyrium glycines]